ncbi:MAG: flagellar hook-length control protein FliK [Oscillospiraceae bacterium]|jgi:hypothetical protein|nr:flagellar hook-length control protein FliK [Oscillospiraceae bacterium]
MVTFNIKDIQYTPITPIEEKPETPIIKQTFDAIKDNISLGKNEFNIKLNPEGLGEISVNITKQDGKMLISMTASKPETAELLNRQLNTLQDIVKNYGAEIKDVTVKTETVKQPDIPLKNIENTVITPKTESIENLNKQPNNLQNIVRNIPSAPETEPTENLNKQLNIIQDIVKDIPTNFKTETLENLNKQLNTLQDIVKDVAANPKAETVENLNKQLNTLQDIAKDAVLTHKTEIVENLNRQLDILQDITKEFGAEVKALATARKAVDIAFRTAALDNIQVHDGVYANVGGEKDVAAIKTVEQPQTQNNNERQYSENQQKNEQQNTPQKDSQQRNKQQYYNLRQEPEEENQDLNDFVKWYQGRRFSMM